MWGALIGAALSIAGSVANGISSSKARKQQKKRLQQQLADNQAWYDRKYNEDPTKRASTQRLLTQMEEQIRDRNRASKGRQAVMGGTEDSVTATKEANAKALADTTSNIVAQNDARKDAIEQQYQNRKYAIENQQAQNEAQAAEDKSKAFGTVLATAGNIASALDSGEGKATRSNTMRQASKAMDGWQKQYQSGIVSEAQNGGVMSQSDLDRAAEGEEMKIRV